jgi:hypothetical protein
MFRPFLAIFRQLFTYCKCRIALDRKSVYSMLLHIVVHTKMYFSESKTLSPFHVISLLQRPYLCPLRMCVLTNWAYTRETRPISEYAHNIYYIYCDMSTHCQATRYKHSSYCCLRVTRCVSEQLPDNALTCHIAPSLRLFIPNSLTAYHLSFLSGGCAFDVFLQVLSLSLSLSLSLPWLLSNR